MNHLLLIALAVLLLAPLSASAQNAPAVRIALAGDSTVTDDAGWGRGFAKSLNDTAECINLARGGRSSKSFRDEGHWQRVLDAKPDYVLIQFGHNDQPGKGPERETDPKTTFRENLARYVDEAREIGAKPVLVTSLARRRWADGGIHIRSDLSDYVEATKAVAAEKDVPLIDLNAWSIAVYQSLGQKGVELISPAQREGGIDATHLNIVGSEMVGPYMAWSLRRAAPELKRHIRGHILQDQRESPADQLVAANDPEMATFLGARAEPPTSKGEKTITVADDGSGDFTTVQQAIRAIPDNNADRTTISIRAGVYTGPIVLPRSKQNVTFVGDGVEQTILTYAINVNNPQPPGIPTRMHGTGVIVLGDGFHARDLTFRNTSGDHGQAMALRLQGDRAVLRNCHLLGWQDTLLVHSNRQYLSDCYIEGRVDFIYGGSTAVFENCTIHSKDGGYITAASTPQEHEFGYVFINCKLTGEGDPAYLGRPWRPYAAVAFINCEIGPHIRPEGWHNWRNPENEKTARYAEYGNTGPGADRSGRVPWSRELTADEAARYTVRNVLAGSDGWDPAEGL